MNAVKISKQGGASIIEFGLVAFVFFLIMWGIFDFARAFYVRNTTQHLTRCMAREAVVIKPSWSNRAKESCLMEMGNSSGDFYWPFYRLQPGDMKGLFTIRYHFRQPSGSPQPQPQIGPLSTSYDNQFAECSDATSSNCITYVQVYVPENTFLEDFGLLRVWLGRSENINEPFASTMMPAESMGYSP